MIRIFPISIVVVILVYFSSLEISAIKIIQKHAVVNEIDENYVSEAKILTARSKRGDAYKTNVTVNFIYPMNDNVTFAIIYGAKNGQKISVEYKLCVGLKHEWLRNFLNEYLEGRRINGCPVSGLFKMINMDLPPKNFPLPILRGTYSSELLYMQTKSRKIMVSFTIILQVS